MRTRQQLQLKPLQTGFTLIELIIVIVIIGILAAVAIPKYIDITAEAKKAAVAGIAGNVGSGAATNFAMCSAYPNDTDKCTKSTACDNTTGWKVLQGGQPDGATMAAGTASGTCAVTKDSVASPDFVYSGT